MTNYGNKEAARIFTEPYKNILVVHSLKLCIILTFKLLMRHLHFIDEIFKKHQKQFVVINVIIFVQHNESMKRMTMDWFMRAQD